MCRVLKSYSRSASWVTIYIVIGVFLLSRMAHTKRIKVL